MAVTRQPRSRSLPPVSAHQTSRLSPLIKSKCWSRLRMGRALLAAERRNPRVIGGDRGTGFFELDAQLRIPNGGFVIDLEHARDGDELLQPALVLTPVSRLGNSETVLAGGGAVFPPASSSSFRGPGTCLQASRPLPRSQIGEVGLFVRQPSPWHG